MELYRIVVTDDAVADLIELGSYIANVLLAPDTSSNYVNEIRTEIANLQLFPARIKPVEEEAWHTRGVRRILVNNFYVYYQIFESEKLVVVLNVIYSKRDQLKALKSIKVFQ